MRATLDAADRHHSINHRQIIPPIQISTTGSPISVVDKVADAIVFSVTLAVIGWVVYGKMSPDAVPI